MKARTAIHLIGDTVVRTDTPMDVLLDSFTTASRGLGIVQMQAITGHGESRRALVPLSAVVWFEELG